MKNTVRTMKDVKVGDKVRYVRPMPEGTWITLDWGKKDGLVIGEIYEVDYTEVGHMVWPDNITLKGFCYFHDTRCFELVQ